MPPKTIQFGKEPWKGTAPKTLPFGTTLNQSMSALAGSQGKVDALRRQAMQAEAEYAKSRETVISQPSDFSKELFPAGGAILGGLAGGVLGGLAASPTVLGIPAGVLAGGAAGAAAGAAGGSALQQKIFADKIQPGEVGQKALEYGALEAVGGPLLKVAGKAVQSLGEGAAKMFIPTSAKEARSLQTYQANKPFIGRVADFFGGKPSQAPQTAAGTAFDYGLMGTESMVGVQAKRATNKVWTNVVSPALDQSQVTVNMPAFIANLEQRILREAPEFSRQKSLLEALDALKNDYKGVGDVPLKQLQKFKEGWAQFIPEKAYRGKPIAGAFRELQNMAADEARSVIYDALGQNVKQAYIDYGNLLALQKLGQTAMTGQKLKGGAGGFVSGLWEMATVPVGTFGGQIVYKVGQGIELLGQPGARTIRDLLLAPFASQGDGTSQPIQIEGGLQPPNQPK